MAKGALQRLFGGTTVPFRQMTTFLRKKLRGSHFIAPVEPHLSASRRIEFDLSSVKFDSPSPHVVLQGIFTTSSLVALLGEFIAAFSAAGLGRGQQPLVPKNEEVRTAVQEVDALWPEFQKKLEHALDVVGDGVSERHSISTDQLSDICDRAVKDFVVLTPIEEHPQQPVVHTDVRYTFATSSSQALLATPESDNSHSIAEVHPAERGSTQYVDLAPQWSQPSVGHTHAKSTVDSLPDVTTVESSHHTPTDEAELPTSIPVLSPPCTPRRKIRTKSRSISGADSKVSHATTSGSRQPVVLTSNSLGTSFSSGSWSPEVTFTSSAAVGLRALGTHNSGLKPRYGIRDGSENQPPLSPAVAHPALRPRGAHSSASATRPRSVFTTPLPRIAELLADESSDMEVDTYF